MSLLRSAMTRGTGPSTGTASSNSSNAGKAVAFILAAAWCAAADAQPTLFAQCPNAEAALNSVAFPLDLPPELEKGETIVEFTVGTEGDLVDVRAVSSSDAAFSTPAVEAIKRMSCKPREAAQRYSLPIVFAKPENLSEALCPNFQRVMRNMGVPARVTRGGNLSGSADLEFTVQASGQIANFVVLRTSNEAFAVEAARNLARLKCSPSERSHQVRSSLSYKVD